jgi:hypothetical protein
MSKATAKTAAKRAAKAVAAAYRSTLGGGSYGKAIAAKATKALEAQMVQQLGAMTLGMHQKSPKKKLSKAEKKARARVLRAHKSSAARAARLPGKKKRKKTSKRSKVAARKKTTTRRASPAPAAKKAPRRKKVATVTADAVIKAAAQKAAKRWLCEGARRSGCGAGGSRVVTGKGSFVRLRPPRFRAG